MVKYGVMFCIKIQGLFSRERKYFKLSIAEILTLGPVVQNLTKLLANVMVKFLSWNMANTFDIFAEKWE